MGARLAASAIILAGGRSSRFGSDKMAVEIDGVPLLQHVIRAASDTCTEVLVAGSPAGLPVTVPDDLPVAPRVVLDVHAYQGPLVALVSAVRSASHDRLLLLAGDMPDVVPAITRRVLTWDTGNDGASLMHDGWPQPFPTGLDRQAVIAQASRLVDAGERSLRSLISTLALDYVSEAEWRTIDPGARSLRDIDRAEDIVH